MLTISMFMMRLAVISMEASSTVFDGFQSFDTGNQSKPLITVEDVKPFAVAPEIKNDTNLLAANNDTGFLVQTYERDDGVAACLIRGLSVDPVDHRGVGLDIGFGDVATIIALVVVAIDVYLLLTNSHFSPLVCAVVSAGFFVAVLLVGVVLWPMAAAWLAIVALWMRDWSWLLFMVSSVASDVY
jgi:hypothetical protein